MKPKLNYRRLSGYTKSELWNYLYKLGYTEKTLGHFRDVSKARLRDYLECTCVECRKLFENPLPKRGIPNQPVCNECFQKRVKELLEPKKGKKP